MLIDETRQTATQRKAEIIQDWNRLYKVSSAYVGRNVIYCVSNLMDGIGQVMFNCSNFKDAFGEYPDDVQNLFRSEDYTEPVEDFIDSADLADLEDIADLVAFWDDVLAESGVPAIFEFEDYEDPHDDLGETVTRYRVDTLTDPFDDEDDAIEAARLSVIDTIREQVKKLITNVEEYRQVADRFDIEPNEYEVYEHWIVDRYFARELEAQGEIVQDFCGMMIWGRTTTGQSIAMDGVVINIVKGLDADHWVWREA